MVLPQEHSIEFIFGFSFTTELVSNFTGFSPDLIEKPLEDKGSSAYQ